MPKKTVFAPLPPSSPASSTSAHAVPSGYGSTPCSFTINALRSGTIKSTPKTPPHKASAVMVNKSGVSAFPSSAHKNNAGSVKMAPAANDSPAEPIVCTRLLSKIELRRSKPRRIPIDTTAAGIDADTVIPTRSPRYAFAAPKTTANKTPTITAVMLNSFISFSAGTKGLNSSFSFSKAMPPVLVFLLAYPNY